MGVDSWVSSPLFNNMIIALSINIIIVSFFSTLPNVVNSKSVLSGQQEDQWYCGPNLCRPTFVGFINTTTTLEWEGGCFRDNKARLELQDTRNGVATVSLQTKDGNNWYCEDKYMFVTPARCKCDYYFKSGKHSCDIQNWESPLEEEFVEKLGVALFKLPSLGTEPPQGYRDT